MAARTAVFWLTAMDNASSIRRQALISLPDGTPSQPAWSAARRRRPGADDERGDEPFGAPAAVRGGTLPHSGYGAPRRCPLGLPVAGGPELACVAIVSALLVVAVDLGDGRVVQG